MACLLPFIGSIPVGGFKAMLNNLRSIWKKTGEGKPDTEGLIRIIGDRGSGKTAYIAALARWPYTSKDSPVKKVEPINDDGKDLIRAAKNLLEQGLELEQTKLSLDPGEMKDYGISIMLQNHFSWRNPALDAKNRQVEINISCKDYSGEFFSDLLFSQNNSLLEDYLEDCNSAEGVALLIDGTSHRKDQEYADGLEKFFSGLARWNNPDNPVSQIRKIACVITKAEQSELIVNRNKPPDFLPSHRFPKVYSKLQEWQNMKQGEGKIKVGFFLASAFGTVGPRAVEGNYRMLTRTEGGTQAVMKYPKLWRPFGLISPLYWLFTGERHKELDKD
jgi:GTPase SAR1 family protein